MIPRPAFERLELRCLLSAVPDITGEFAGTSDKDGSTDGPEPLQINIVNETAAGDLKATFSTQEETNVTVIGTIKADKTFALDWDADAFGRSGHIVGHINSNGHLVGTYSQKSPLAVGGFSIETGTFNCGPLSGTPRNMLGEFDASIDTGAGTSKPIIFKVDTQHGGVFQGRAITVDGVFPMTGQIRSDNSFVTFAWIEGSLSPESQVIGTLSAANTIVGQFLPFNVQIIKEFPITVTQVLSVVPAAGAVDTNFGTVGKADVGFQSNDIAVDADNKIVVAGSINHQFDIGRFNRDGTVDTLFGTAGQFIGGIDATANGVAIQDDGKIVMVGTQGDLTQNDTTTQMLVVRLNANGTPDDTFGDNGTVLLTFPDNSQGNSVVIQDDGEIVVAGSDNGDFALARLNANGTVDTNFGPGGQVITPFTFQGGGAGALSVTLQSDGKIVAAGSDANPLAQDESSAFAIARYNTDGTLDTGFGTSGQILGDFNSTSELQRVVVDSSGRILAGGFTGTADAADLALVRYTSTGAVDTTFGSAGEVVTDFNGDDHATALIIQTDGNIVTSGISRRTGSAKSFVARYKSNGTLDATFGNAGKFFPDGDNSVQSHPRVGNGPGDGQSFADFFKTAKAIVAQQKGGRILLLVSTDTGSTITQIVADGIPPSATVTAVKLTIVKKVYTLTITFSDNLGVNSGTLKTGNIVITGPKKFKQVAKLVTVKTAGARFTATYSVTGPAGKWDLPDNGVYSVAVQKNQVADTAGNYIHTGTLKTFAVKIAKVKSRPAPRAIVPSNLLASSTMMLASSNDDDIEESDLK